MKETLEQVRDKQRLWFQRMSEQGYSRSSLEGRILESGGSPNYPFYRKILDTLFGPKGPS